MSGGHFDYQQYLLREIADTIEHDIARALKPKPDMIHEDYWVINEMDYPNSWHVYPRFYQTFETQGEAVNYLKQHEVVEEAAVDHPYVHTFKDDILFQSKDLDMIRTKDTERIPVLYSIHHAEYDRYPYDEDVLELSDKSIETMKEAYRQIRIAEIYAQRVDWMMSGDDGEETMQKRLAEELRSLEDELLGKDWTFLFRHEEEE